MSSVRVMTAQSVPPQPWKNGGGQTRELFVWPAGESWKVRVSLADIEGDGAFSAFPGATRWFAVVEGAGVILTLPEGERRVLPGDAPLRFDGACAPMCRLVDGPTRDLNLMLRDADGAMALAVDHRPWSPAGDGFGLFTAVGGFCYAPGSAIRTEAHSLLWFDAPPPAVRFAADADAGTAVGWWLQFSTRGRQR